MSAVIGGEAIIRTFRSAQRESLRQFRGGALVTMDGDDGDVAAAAGEIENVSHAFQPEGLAAASNSP